MDPNTQQQGGQENDTPWLSAAIKAMDFAEKATSFVPPAKIVFYTVSAILQTINDSKINEADCVQLVQECANVCTVLARALHGKRLEDLNDSVNEAIKQLTVTLAEIRVQIEQGKRNAVFRFVHASSDKAKLTRWKSALIRALNIFNTELAINTHTSVSATQTIASEVQHSVTNIHTIVSDIHTIVKGQEGTDGQNLSTRASLPGESPPQPARAFFGRDALIEEIVGFAEHHTPIALIGPGGIGKTSIALTVLHDDRIKQRFGDNRRFIRCDQFPASLTHFLGRLSKVTGAGVDNPEDLTPLQPFLSSREMVIVLDNAESILDPQGADAEEIYTVVEELCRFSNIWLCITSRISTIPLDCETFDIPTLSMEAAGETFHRAYKNSERSDLVNNILEQLDFHPLSITLLATVAHHNKWNIDRLAREWEVQRTGLLRTRQKKSLAATIELSLASPMFQELGPDARNLLGVVAFFPQGVNENNLDQLFPTIPNPADIFDEFCVLSLTYRSDGFLTMLAPLRDYLCPKDPKSSPLLVTTKEHYFGRLSVGTGPEKPGPEETRWITSEDVNVEHLLDVFMTIDTNSEDVWSACYHFMRHIRWHKHRPIVLGPRVEALPDDHPFKPQCLLELSRLCYLVGNSPESKRLLVSTLKLQRERKDDLQVAITLKLLAEVNRQLMFFKEGIQQAKEAAEIYRRLNNMSRQADLLQDLALLYAEDNQIDAAEEAASRAVGLSSDEHRQSRTCEHHHLLSHIYRSRGETEAAICQLKTALGIATSLNSQSERVSILSCLVMLLLEEDRFDDAQVYLESFKSHLIHDPYRLGTAMVMQAGIWQNQGKLEEAKSALLCVTSVYKKLGVPGDVIESLRMGVREIEEEMNNPVISNESDDDEFE